ncbi:MAG: hypothetical protein BM564_04215 [Bacteroidetes bacterium MedPE-SWsnd-G2]|nr:MAG: hypothetical protein BM564_04215 [Bacteroidetes bacterium MedPE-SWsnd-G2]
MIVNPQLFNYRLIISSLIVAFAVLGVFSFSNYQSINSEQQYLENEKKIVESELSQMIKRYDAIASEKGHMTEQLKAAKLETTNALDSLRLVNGDIEVISKFKNQLIILQSKETHLFSKIDSLKALTQKLSTEKLLATASLNKEREMIAALLAKNRTLEKTISEAALITANSFSAMAKTKISDKQSTTTKASKTKAIEVCFTIAENILAEPGERTLYLQILNPKNNIIADKGAVAFENASLIYSKKINTFYNKQNKDICEFVTIENDDEPLSKGSYFVSIFENNRRLGGTTIILD